MHHERIALGSAGEVSPHVSHVTVSSHAKGLVAGVGLLSGLLAGFIAFADCLSVTSDEQTFTKTFFRSPALSSVAVRRVLLGALRLLADVRVRRVEPGWRVKHAVLLCVSAFGCRSNGQIAVPFENVGLCGAVRRHRSFPARADR